MVTDGQIFVTADGTSGTVSVLVNQGNGTFATRVSYAVGASPGWGPTLADINGDGRPDILTTDQNSDTVSVLLNQGSGTFGIRVSYAMGVSPNGKATVMDVNGDGRADILTTDGGSNTVSIRLNQGNGTFGSRMSYAVGNSPVGGAITGDLNGDGRPDLITTDFSSSSVSILFNQGNGTFGAPIGTPGSQRLIFGDSRGMTEINQINLSTQFLAKKAMPVLDGRLDRLSRQQGVFGAIQSRLETASRVISTTALNYRSAESQIRDTDIAEDSAQQTRLTIVQRAASAVLAQANLQPQIALKLLLAN